MSKDLEMEKAFQKSFATVIRKLVQRFDLVQVKPNKSINSAWFVTKARKQGKVSTWLSKGQIGHAERPENQGKERISKTGSLDGHGAIWRRKTPLHLIYRWRFLKAFLNLIEAKINCLVVVYMLHLFGVIFKCFKYCIFTLTLAGVTPKAG